MRKVENQKKAMELLEILTFQNDITKIKIYNMNSLLGQTKLNYNVLSTEDRQRKEKTTINKLLIKEANTKLDN